MSPAITFEKLNSQTFALALDRLVKILCDCVADGASISFLKPLSAQAATEFWQKVGSGVEKNHRRLLVARQAQTIVGTVQLDLDTPPNQPHRADVAKLMVHPTARRLGIARQLMLALEDEARQARRSLLTLDTRTGDAAEQLYQSIGYRQVGIIPNYALSADGSFHATTIFYKNLML